MNRAFALIAVLVGMTILFLYLSYDSTKVIDTRTAQQRPEPPGADLHRDALAAFKERAAPASPQTVSQAWEAWKGPRVFRIPIADNPPDLDPVKFEDVTSHHVASKIFNQLIRYNERIQLVPDLAEALPVWNAEERSFTFKLRRGVKFHNGLEMTAKDVKYSWERLLDPGVSKRMVILEGVLGAKEKIEGKGEVKETKGLQVVDPYTFKVLLVQQRPTFLHEISMANTGVIPEGIVEATEKAGKSFRSQPVGTGPFKLVKWTENLVLELTRHDEYFRGRPGLEQVIFEVVPKPEMRLERFKKGEFEVCDIPFGQFKRMRQEYPQYLICNPTFDTGYLGITLHTGQGAEAKPTEPLGKSLALRQAINHAIDRRNLTEQILEGQATPATSILPPGMMAYQEGLTAWTFSPAKAREYLAEAGFPEGKGLRPLLYMYRNDPDAKRIAVAIQADLAAVGIQVELQALDWAAYLDRIDKNPPDLFSLRWVADYNDADNFLSWLFHTKRWGNLNHVRYSNAQVDTLFDKALQTMDQAERIRLYQEAEAMIVREVPWCLTYNKLNFFLRQPYVRNILEQLTTFDAGAGMGYVEFQGVYYQNP